tara:strand:+ start:437 stop:1195 length:759 start_codon:yes stop_codon:yes gene_type:complete
MEEKIVKTKSNQWSTQEGLAMSKKKALAKKRKQDYSKCNVSELKEILKEKKLPVSGTKSELIERLTDPDWRPKTRKAKKSGIIYDTIKEIKEAYVFYGLLFLGFYFFVVYKIGYDDIRSQSPKRLGDGTYTPEKELTEFTMDELIYIFITVPGTFIGLTLGVLFLVIVLGTVAETLEKLYKSQKANNPTSKNEQSFALIYIASLLIPIAGIIIGAIYLTNKNKQTREAGTNCLMIAISSIVAYWLFVINLFL